MEGWTIGDAVIVVFPLTQLIDRDSEKLRVIDRLPSIVTGYSTNSVGVLETMEEEESN